MREIIILSMRYCTFPSQKPLFRRLLKECFLFLSLFLPFPFPSHDYVNWTKDSFSLCQRSTFPNFIRFPLFHLKKDFISVIYGHSKNQLWYRKHSFPWLTDSIQIYTTIKTKYQSLNLRRQKRAELVPPQQVLLKYAEWFF